MANNINKLLYEAGISPATAPGTTRSARSAKQARQVFAPTPPPVAPVGANAATPGGFGDGIQWDTSHMVGGNGTEPSKGDSSFGADLWGFIKKGIDIIDTPRAFVVSGVKELTDAIQGSEFGHQLATNDTWGMGQSEADYQADKARLGSGSWEDFKSQGWRNMGFGEVVEATSPDRNKWVKRAAGFAGDVALDPLMHSGAVISKGAEGATKAGEAVAAAFKSGGRNEIAKTLGTNAIKAGIHKSPAVERLIAEAGLKGSGGLTEGALKRAGVSVAEREALGVGKMAKTFYGFEVPGSRVVAEAGAATRGRLKEVFGQLPGANAYRALKIANEGHGGERTFVDMMRRKGVTAGTRAEAARTLLTVNKSRAVSRGWFDRAVRMVHETFGKELHAATPEVDVAATHALEGGATDALSTKGREFLDATHADLIKAGADVGYREGFVPHIVTPEFRDLAAVDSSLQKWVSGVGTKQAFEKARTLEAGSEFMGEFLQHGTIEEINKISMDHVGVRLFEDRLSEIVPQYLIKARKGLEVSAQKQALKDFQVAVEAKSKTLVRDLTDAEKATLKAEKKAAGAARVNQSIALGEGITVRRSEAGVAREALMSQKREVWKRVNEIDQRVFEAGRARTVAESKLATLEGRLRSAQGSLEEWTKAAKNKRGNEAAVIRRKIKNLEAQVAAVGEQRTAAAKAVDEIVSGSGRGRSWQSQGFKAQVDALAKERDRLLAEHSKFSGQLDALKLATTPLGERAVRAEQIVSQETAKVAKYKVGAEKATNAAQVAADSFSFVAADRNTVIDVLNKTEAAIDDAFSKVTSLPETGKRLTSRKTAAYEIRDRVAVARQLLEKGGDPAFEMMAKLEANAAIWDMKAWKAGNEALSAEQMVKTLSDPKFREYIVRQSEHGFKMMDDTFQLPNWVDNALQVEHRIKDPKFWDGFARGLNKFNNLWKGWATARPGFMTRNLYGGLFNIYLEGGAGALKSVAEFTQFWRIYKANPEKYLEEALAKGMDQTTINQMDDALKVVFGTGGGLVPAEVEAGLGRRLNVNPLSTDNVAIRATRAGSENIEAVMRGGHAYDVMKRGGTADLAMDTVSKWHFNYTDITEFDRKAKKIIPFWTFYSRNVALQAHVWSHMPQKLNATYFNFGRNFGDNSGDTDRPAWFDEGGAIQMGQGGQGHDTPYLFPDLPSIQAVNDVQNLMNPLDGKLIGNLAPEIKLPFEHFAGKQMFSGVPFKNSYAETVDGQKVGREAPLWGQVPGVFQLLQAAGLTDTNASGQKVMGDQAQYMTEGMFPFLSDVSRLVPNQPKQQAKASQNWMSFLGLGLKYNTDDTRKGEQYRQSLVEKAKAKRKKELGL